MDARRRVSPFLVMGCLVVMAISWPQSTAHPPTYRRIPRVAAGTSLEEVLLQAASRYQIHPALIAAIIEVESGWRSHAVSPKGAMGLMQLMPQTALRMGVAQPFDIAANVFGGVKYFRQLLDQFRGNYLLALAAYNAGPGAVTRYGTVPPYFETVQYIPKVAYWYRHYERKIRAAYREPKSAPVKKS